MGRPTNRKRALLQGLQKANMVNPRKGKQLRPRKNIATNQIKSVKRVIPTLQMDQPKGTFDTKMLTKKFEKAQKILQGKNLRRNAIIAALAKKKVASLVEQIEAQTQPIQTPSPEKVLGMKRNAKITDKGMSTVNSLVKVTHGMPLSTKRTLDKARRSLENIIKYEIQNGSDIKLLHLEDVVKERKNRLGLDEKDGKTLLFSLDKGHGRVVSTISFVFHPRPCSYYNHLPVQVWEGADKYTALKDKDIGTPYDLLVNSGYTVFLGGDLSFLSTNFGLSCSMTFACLWCCKKFEKKKEEVTDEIDFAVYEDRSKAEVEQEIKKHKFVPKKDNLIEVSRSLVVPPILHAKIKIGNSLFEKLFDIAEKEDNFQKVCKKWKLDVDRKSQEVIYARFHGNDIKTLCRALPDFQTLPASSDPDFQKIITVLQDFDAWSKLVSSTKTILSDAQLQQIACKEGHSDTKDCCQTAILVKGLSDIGGFGNSPLIHVILMHLGPFIWEHRMIGAVAEEGIEAVHSKLEREMKLHKRRPLECLQNALKWMGIDTLLSDAGKMTL